MTHVVPRELIRMTGKPEDGEDQIGQIFAPKDEHCGIWHSSPNRRCHSSFGDQGTTASVNCYGHLMQMSQFLGVGHSGIFSMDHRSTEEPYLVARRARNLDTLSCDRGEYLSYMLCFPSQFCPDKPPQVKWVNWRWPRYEYDTKLPNVRAWFQWVVHQGTVLQQFGLKNSSDQPVDFKYRFPKNMSVRDLNHTISVDFFNNAKEEYSCVPGPNV